MQELFVLLWVQRKQALIQQNIYGMLASALQNKVATSLSQDCGGAIDQIANLRR